MSTRGRRPSTSCRQLPRKSASCSSVRADSVVGIVGHQQDVGRAEDALGDERHARRAVEEHVAVLVGQRSEDVGELLGRLLRAVEREVEVPVRQIRRHEIEVGEVGGLDRRVDGPLPPHDRPSAALHLGAHPQQEGGRALRVEVPQQRRLTVTSGEVREVHRRCRLPHASLDAVRRQDLHDRANSRSALTRSPRACLLALEQVLHHQLTGRERMARRARRATDRRGDHGSGAAAPRSPGTGRGRPATASCARRRTSPCSPGAPTPSISAAYRSRLARLRAAWMSAAGASSSIFFAAFIRCLVAARDRLARELRGGDVRVRQRSQRDRRCPLASRASMSRSDHCRALRAASLVRWHAVHVHVAASSWTPASADAVMVEAVELEIEEQHVEIARRTRDAREPLPFGLPQASSSPVADGGGPAARSTVCGVWRRGSRAATQGRAAGARPPR